YDPAKVDLAFRQSGLMRDKWDEPHRADGTTYGWMTINQAFHQHPEPSTRIRDKQDLSQVGCVFGGFNGEVAYFQSLEDELTPEMTQESVRLAVDLVPSAGRRSDYEASF